MDYFPAFLKVDGKACLVVGGGAVALRKVRALRVANAAVTIVAPETCDALRELIACGEVEHVARRFRPSDLNGVWLVASATNDPEAARRVYAAANEARVFCNSVDDVANCSYLTPAVVDRSPVVVAVSSGGAAPVLARKIRTRIEAMLPATTGRLAGLARQWRERVALRLTDALSRRRFWESVFSGQVADDVHARRDDRAVAGMARALRAFESSDAKNGFAWLVGAGPGDPSLVTLRALQIMHDADVILHDRLVSDEILKLARRDAEFVAVGKTPNGESTPQHEINALLVRLVREGKRVCRLKGGDPLIFGRGGEEAEVLDAAGLRYEIVPGITAASGCAASSGIPLTHRDASQAVVLLTAHGQDNVDRLDWPSLARDRQTLAVYMGVRRFPDIMRNLIRFGRAADTPIAIIERGTTPAQRIVRGRLGQLAMIAEAHRIRSPSLLIIGEVAATALSQYQSISVRECSTPRTTRTMQ